MSSDQVGFTKVVAIVQVFTCDICGAAVVIDPYREGPQLVFEQHRAWHDKASRGTP